jgi:uncharacterized protein
VHHAAVSHAPSDAALRPAFAAWGRFVLRFRFPLFLMTLGFTGLMATQARTKLKIDTTIESLTSSDSPAFLALERLRDDFGRDDLFFVLAEGPVFSLPFLERLKALHEELEALDIPIASLGQRRSAQVGVPAPAPPSDSVPGFEDDEGWGEAAGGSVVDQITSLINARDVRGRAGAVDVGELLDEWPAAADLPALQARVLADPILRGNLVGPNATHTVIMLRTAFMDDADTGRVLEKLADISARHQADGFALSVAGTPAMTTTLGRLMLRDLRVLMGGALLCIVTLLALMFRHPLAVIGPMLVVLMSVVATLGGMAAAGRPMTMLTNILPAFLIAVGIGATVHVLSVYRELRRAGVPNDAAIVRTLGLTGKPIVFTTLTTVCGLLSFRLASMDAIRDLGTFGAFGVSVAMVHTLLFLPIVLSLNKKSLFGARAGEPDRIDRALARFDALSSGHRWVRVLVVSGLICAGAVAAALTVPVWHDPLSWMPDEEPTRVAMEALDDHVGGSATVALLIEPTDPRGVKDPAFIAGLARLEAHIRAYRDPETGRDIITSVISVLDVVRETNRALHGGEQTWYRLPTEARALSDMLFLFESSDPDELRRLATTDLSKTQMVVRLEWMDATAYTPFGEHVQRGIEEHLAGVAAVQPTGSVYTLLSTVGLLVMDMLRSFAGAFLVIAVLMVVLLGSLKLGLIAMVPNLMPVVLVLGTMGVVGIPIDMANILIASIILGIAVDDTIHFLHHFKAERDAGQSTDAAIGASLRHSGRAIVTTSVLLCVGFSVFLAGSMLNLQRFGALIALAVAYALLTDLAVAPALLRALYRDPAKS